MQSYIRSFRARELVALLFVLVSFALGTPSVRPAVGPMATRAAGSSALHRS